MTGGTEVTILKNDRSSALIKTQGGGGIAAQNLTPKIPLQRYHLVELLGSFLPRISNEVAIRLVIKS